MSNEQPTPFPLAMPDKYKEYLSSTVREDQDKPIDIVQSYRNYYRAKLQKRIKCKECKGSGYHDRIDIYDIPCPVCYEEGYLHNKIPTWTRHQKPSWLEI